MFESIESTLYPIVCDINTYLSNYILVFLLIGVRQPVAARQEA